MVYLACKGREPSADAPLLLNFFHAGTCYQLSTFSFWEARSRRGIKLSAVVAFMLSVSKVVDSFA